MRSHLAIALSLGYYTPPSRVPYLISALDEDLKPGSGWDPIPVGAEIIRRF
jgi:hypothetical protein